MSSVYDFSARDLGGKEVKLANYKGKVLLIVNIASQCGLTPQLDGLQKLYETYRERGFEILAFPSNDFMQEPKEGERISEFCKVNYGVTFKVFAKGPVKGAEAPDLYRFLAEETGNFLRKGYPMWNFHKYLINKKGEVVNWYNPWKKPESDKIAADIEKCLAG
ncbi:MAG: glutathione peroxidase [Chitinophagales bacterium]